METVSGAMRGGWGKQLRGEKQCRELSVQRGYTTSGLARIGHRRGAGGGLVLEGVVRGGEEQAWERPTVKFRACGLAVFVGELGRSLHRVTCPSWSSAITQTSSELHTLTHSRGRRLT